MGRPSKAARPAAAAPVVILVRPQLGENIGMAARAMLNCGLGELRLVAPRDEWPNAKADRAASGADDVLAGAKVFDDVARPATIAAIAQGFIVQKLGFANAPATFVPGPNGVV